jgi:mono/diheme cytochrome c family protein
VYAAQKCSVCHAVAGKGSKANPLDGVGAKLSAEDIRNWIVKPAEMTAKTKSTKKPPMPAKYTSLPAADLDALVAYMQSLK